MQVTYQNFLVDEQDTSVCLQVHSGGLLDDFKTLNSNISLIRETKTHEVQHFVAIVP